MCLALVLAHCYALSTAHPLYYGITWLADTILGIRGESVEARHALYRVVTCTVYRRGGGVTCDLTCTPTHPDNALNLKDHCVIGVLGYIKLPSDYYTFKHYKQGTSKYQPLRCSNRYTHPVSLTL